MVQEISGSIAVKKSRLFFFNKRYYLIFVWKKILVVGSGVPVYDYISEERGTVDWTSILSSDEDTFEIPYLQIRKIVMQKGGFSCSGRITIDTFNGKYKFDIEMDQDYRTCVNVVKSTLNERLVDKSPLPAVKYCPECREEFQDWVTVCPDCGVELVDNLPEMKETPVTQSSNMISYVSETTDFSGVEDVTEDTMVSIAVAPNEMIAQMWKGLLQEHNIRSMIKRTGLSGLSMNPKFQTPFTGDFEILVMLPQAKKAFAILQPFMDV